MTFPVKDSTHPAPFDAVRKVKGTMTEKIDDTRKTCGDDLPDYTDPYTCMHCELPLAERQRDEARKAVVVLTRLVDKRSKERDEALAQADAMNERMMVAKLTLEQACKERDEARADVERLSDASTHWQLMLKRETEEVERLERLLEIERMGIRPIDEVRCEAYRRGAEAMREAIASACIGFVGDAIRALPIPGEP